MRIEKVEKLSTKKERYTVYTPVKKRKRRRKYKGIMESLYTKDTTSPLYSAFKSDYKRCPEIHKGAFSSIFPCGNKIDRETFVDAYVNALKKRNDIIPCPYFTKSYLMADDSYKLYCDQFGWIGFVKYSTSFFWFPAMKEVNGDDLFKSREAYYNFPNSVSLSEGTRVDTEYLYNKNVSMHLLEKQVIVKWILDYGTKVNCYALRYDEHSKDDALKKFESMATLSTMSNQEIKVMSNLLFTDYGQHRFIMERASDGTILTVIIWEDFGDMIAIVGHYAAKIRYVKGEDLGSNWNDYKYKINYMYKYDTILYPELVSFYHFISKFPDSTNFVVAGPGYSTKYAFLRTMMQPVKIFEIRTLQKVLVYNKNGKIKKPVGKPAAAVMAGSKFSDAYPVLEKNYSLIKGASTGINFENLTEEEKEKVIKRRKKNSAIFLKLQRTSKILENFEKNSGK